MSTQLSKAERRRFIIEIRRDLLSVNQLLDGKRPELSSEEVQRRVGNHLRFSVEAAMNIRELAREGNLV